MMSPSPSGKHSALGGKCSSRPSISSRIRGHHGSETKTKSSDDGADERKEQPNRRHHRDNYGSDPWTYRGTELRHLDFPLGGIGTGNILLQGDGCLRGWDILNQFHSSEHRRLHNPPPLGGTGGGKSNNNEKSNNCNCWAISAAYDDEDDPPSPGGAVVHGEHRAEPWVMVEKLPRPSILLRSANHCGIRDSGGTGGESVTVHGNNEPKRDARHVECQPQQQHEHSHPDVATTRLPEDVPEISIRARYPIAVVSYNTPPSFPLNNIRMEAMTPLVPSDSKQSGYPLAVFVLTFDNPHPTKSVSVDVMQSTLNFLGWDGGRKQDGVPSRLWGGNLNEPFAHTSSSTQTPPKPVPTGTGPQEGMTSTDRRGSSTNGGTEQYSCQGLFLHTKDDLERDLTRKGSIALFAIVRSSNPSDATFDSSTTVSASPATPTIGLIAGASCEDEVFRRFRDRDFEDVDPGNATPPSPEGTTYAGAVVQSLTKIPPSSTARVVFGLAWHFPYRPCTTPRSNLPRDFYGNLYASWFNSARDVAVKFCDTFVAASDDGKRRKNLLEVTRRFVETLYRSTIPWEVLESAAGRLAIPRSPTLFRTEAGIVLGTGGNACGPLNGTDVFGYTTLLERIFPDLAKDMLTSVFVRNFDLNGGGCLASFGEGGFAIDGALASIAKVYLVVLQSDPGLGFLKSVWPNLKRQLGLVLDKQVTKDGLIVGPQQTTYGDSLHGANTLVGSHLLTALRATEAMANLVGDVNFAKKCSRQAAASLEAYERLCWRDDLGYYVGNTDDEHARHRAPGSYSYGTGCCLDQLAGTELSRACGFGSVFDPAREARARRSILRRNAVASPAFRDEDFRLGPGDSGVRVCTYDDDERTTEEERMPHSDRVASGLEYPLAAGMIGDGNREDALTVCGWIRHRQSGARQSPWNEPETGLYAARSMSGWNLFDQACGFHYDSTTALLRVLPPATHHDSSDDDFSCFCACHGGFGEFSRHRKLPRTTGATHTPTTTTTTTTATASLKVLHGSIELKTIHIDDVTATTVVVSVKDDEHDGQPDPKASITKGVITLETKLTLGVDSTLELTLSRGTTTTGFVWPFREAQMAVLAPMALGLEKRVTTTLRRIRCLGVLVAVFSVLCFYNLLIVFRGHRETFL